MNIPIYPGSSSFFPGNTPFGFYDNDYQFQVDADKVVTFCARRLGYPITDIELQDINFWAAFEEATTVYGNELYAYQVRDNMLTLEGAPTATSINNTIITPNLGYIIKLSQQYGEEAGVIAGGYHLNKQGLNPFAETGVDANNDALYDFKAVPTFTPSKTIVTLLPLLIAFVISSNLRIS